MTIKAVRYDQYNLCAFSDSEQERIVRKVKRLEAQYGFSVGRFLDSGSFSLVYQLKSDPSAIIKVSTCNPSHKYLHRFMNHPSEHFPKKVRYLGYMRDPMAHIYLMEKLKPLHSEKHKHLKSALDGFLGDASPCDMEEQLKVVLTYLTKNKSSVPESFVAALNEVRVFGASIDGRYRNGLGIDLHSGNVMLRGSTLVITDPFVDIGTTC